MKKLTTLFVLLFFIASCSNERSLLPKPRIYPKIEFPERNFKEFINPDCPFKTRIPAYTEYRKDSNKNKNEEQFDCWFDLHSTDLNAFLHLSYVSFDGRKRFDELVQDAFEMVDKHNSKANYRDELALSFPESSVYGLLFEIDGPVASPLQFYLTDSLQHFLRGSLYFKAEVNRDSILPVYEFVKQDLEPFFEEFEWLEN